MHRTPMQEGALNALETGRVNPGTIKLSTFATDDEFIPPIIPQLTTRQKRRAKVGAYTLAAITSYCRNTGQNDAATLRLYVNAFSFALGQRIFKASFETFGRHVEKVADKSADAYTMVTSRLVKTHEADRDASGYPGIRIKRGYSVSPSKSDISTWDFEALPFILSIQDEGLKLEKTVRAKTAEIRRERAFDIAFAKVMCDFQPKEEKKTPKVNTPPAHPGEEDKKKFKRRVANALGATRNALLMITEDVPMLCEQLAEAEEGGKFSLCDEIRLQIEEIQQHKDSLRKLFTDRIEHIFALDSSELKALDVKTLLEENESVTSNSVGELTETENVAVSGNEKVSKVTLSENEICENTEQIYEKTAFTGNEFVSALPLEFESPVDEALAALECYTSQPDAGEFHILLCDDAEHDRLTNERDRLKSKGVSSEEILKRGIGPQKAITPSAKMSAAEITNRLPGLLQRATDKKLSFIVAPPRKKDHPFAARLIQVDECSPDLMDTLAPFATLQFLTSNGNGQSILILPQTLTVKECEQIKDRLFAVLKSFGANRGSSGASRWVGSYNFKPKYKDAQGNYPRVSSVQIKPNLVAQPDDLKAHGLLAPLSEINKRNVVHEQKVKDAKRKLPGDFPEYDDLLARSDRSAADYKFASQCAERGFTVWMVEDKLREVSSKGNSRRDDYISRTVAKAFGNSTVMPSTQTNHTKTVRASL